MLAQVLWRQIIYQHKHNSKTERGKIPQGTIVFLAQKTKDFATILYSDLILVIPSKALKVLESEEDIVPIQELQEKYHNKRSSMCLVK